MKIFIEEEYGYRYWIWDTNKTADELVLWWSSLETVSPFFFDPSQSLPFGTVSPLSEDCMGIPETEGYLHLHCDDDSEMRIKENVYYHKGYFSCE